MLFRSCSHPGFWWTVGETIELGLDTGVVGEAGSETVALGDTDLLGELGGETRLDDKADATLPPCLGPGLWSNEAADPLL